MKRGKIRGMLIAITLPDARCQMLMIPMEMVVRAPPSVVSGNTFPGVVWDPLPLGRLCRALTIRGYFFDEI